MCQYYVKTVGNIIENKKKVASYRDKLVKVLDTPFLGVQPYVLYMVKIKLSLKVAYKNGFR